MEVAFLDSSAILTIGFRQRGGAELEARLQLFSELRASNLLEAEVRSAYSREHRAYNSEILEGINWVIPDRPLTPELAKALEAGYARGADLWHLATALYMTADPADVTFVTLDQQQRRVARGLGFRV